MNNIEAAKDFAKKAHQHQKRKNSDEPYVEHPIRVAKVLQDAGYSEEVIIAGLLHDTVEDNPDVTIAEIEEKFGKKVADIVAQHTENKSLSWEERKEHTIEVVKTASIEVKALIIADKLDNLKSLKQQYDVIGEEVWKVFKRGKEKQKWYNCSIVDAISTIENTPAFFAEYKQLVQAVFE